MSDQRYPPPERYSLTTKKACARYQDDPHIAGVGTYFPSDGEPEWTINARHEGKKRTVRIGKVGTVSRSIAAHVAKQLTEVGSGRYNDRLTVGEVGEAFLANRRERWKEETRRSNRYSLRRMSDLLEVPITQLSRQQVAIWHRQTGCDRSLAVLSGLMTYAAEMDLIPSGLNPCRGLRRKQRQFKGTFIGEQGYRRLGEVLLRELVDHPAEVIAIILIALTGARIGEILKLTRKQIHSEGFQLDESKTGPHFLVLIPEIQWIFGRLPHGAPDEPLILRKCGNPLSGSALTKLWQRLRQESGLPRRARIHDLRHGFASTGINFGEDLTVIGLLLGHRDPASTLTYAHLTSRTVQTECQRAGDRLEGFLFGSPAERPKP